MLILFIFSTSEYLEWVCHQHTLDPTYLYDNVASHLYSIYAGTVLKNLVNFYFRLCPWPPPQLPPWPPPQPPPASSSFSFLFILNTDNRHRSRPSCTNSHHQSQDRSQCKPSALYVLRVSIEGWY